MLQIVLYQNEELTEECDFVGYQRFEYVLDEIQKLVWSMNQNKPQPVWGYKVGGYKKKFNQPRILMPKNKLSIDFDHGIDKKVRQYNRGVL